MRAVEQGAQNPMPRIFSGGHRWLICSEVRCLAGFLPVDNRPDLFYGPAIYVPAVRAKKKAYAHRPTLGNAQRTRIDVRHTVKLPMCPDDRLNQLLPVAPP